MKAIICRNWGAPSDLVLEDVPLPPLGNDDVRIAVRAAGVNFADTLIIKGSYQVKPPLPFTPGFEVAGELLECGPGVTGFLPGDRVLAVMSHGGFAEQVVAPAAQVYPLPAHVDAVTAAGFIVAYGTSHLGLKHRAGLRAGETLVVHGAAGGVGLTAVEVGHNLGATVIATAGGAEKLAIAADHGAHHLIDYKSESIRERVKALTDGRGADVIYDPVGGNVFDASLRAIAPGGRILVVGFASGTVPQIPANILLVKNVTVIGYTWGPFRTLAPAVMDASVAELLEWLAAGRIRPHVSHTYPLEAAAEAMQVLLDRRATGKVVLTVGQP